MSYCEYEKDVDQALKGKVTEINHSLLYFKIDNKLRVYIDIAKPLPEFPGEDSEVAIINPRKVTGKTDTILIGHKTRCKFQHVFTLDDPEKLELFSVLKANNADEDELIKMDYILRQLESLIPENSLSKCLVTLDCNAPLVSNGLQRSALKYKRSLNKIQVKLPSDLNYVNDNSDLYTFLRFDGMWSYNVYPNRSLQKVTDSNVEYLFGILDVDPISGNFSLSNKTVKIQIKFYFTDKDLYIFKNCLVMLRKWTCFTEIFQDKRALSLKYILLNVEDVIIIESMENSCQQLFYQKNDLWDTEQRKSVFVQILRIAEVIYGYSKGPECWIEALILEKGCSKAQRLVYLVLTDSHITIVPFLKEHVVYQIFYNKEPKTLNIELYKELHRVRKSKDLYRIDKDTIFQESNVPPVPQNDLLLENFEDLNKFIRTATQNQMFSCCLKVYKKDLRDNSNFASWIPKRHENDPNFGTPGRNIQTRLNFHDGSTNSYIDLYFSDRDNHVTPLGLIDGMRIKVKHVQVYKNKYIKTNVFSSFEILEYCPEIMFSSVNLSFSNRSTWHWQDKTPKTLLGMFSCLPQKCIVHGTFLFQAILSINITPVCDKCKRSSIAGKPCKSCDISDRDLNIDICICVQDSINPKFYVKTENKHFLYQLIGLRNSFEIKHFTNAFQNIDVVNVNFCNLEELNTHIKDADSKTFLDKLIELIRSEINFKLYPMVDALCMKQLGAEYKQLKMIEFVFR